MTQSIEADMNVNAHRELGLTIFNHMNAVASKKREKLGFSPQTLPASPYEYAASASFKSFLYLKMDLSFFNNSQYFSGEGGGISAGTGLTAGIAFFNYPLEEIQYWQATFEYNIGGLGTTIFFWGMHNEFIGNFTGAFLNIGGGVGGGKGAFHPD